MLYRNFKDITFYYNLNFHSHISLINFSLKLLVIKVMPLLIEKSCALLLSPCFFYGNSLAIHLNFTPFSFFLHLSRSFSRSLCVGNKCVHLQRRRGTEEGQKARPLA